MRGSCKLVMGALALLLLVAGPGYGSGFGIFEQGSKAMGMAGAFTAQADDPSALFHNVGGLAFVEKSDFMVGTTLIALGDSTFEGAAPFPGPGAEGEMESQLVTPSHVYYVRPINDTWKFGFGFNNPFGLVTEWADPDRFPGRLISTRAELTTYDLMPALGWQVTPKFGIGFGLIARFAEVELDRYAALVNPFTLRPADVAEVNLQSDLESGFGYTVGFLHRYNNSFSWGFNYRSKVEVDWGGDGRLTQVSTGDPRFDAAVAASLPFNMDLPIEAGVEFPDMASLGLAFALSPTMLLETDINWAGWSSVDQIGIDFTSAPALSSTLDLRWDDTMNYRLGLAFGRGSGSEWRVGYVYDENPIPDETLGPLLPDGDRNGVTLGYGWTNGKRVFDIAFMYLPFDERTTTVQESNFNGTYETTAYLLGLSLTF